MNIFVLSEDPIRAAQAQCNKHVVRMVLETAQLLGNAHPSADALYQHTHYNHPCSKWVRQSLSNYKWLLLHGWALCEEYTRRYGKVHRSQCVIERYVDAQPDLPNVGLTPFSRSIKEPWKGQTSALPVVEAYRAYYVGDKSRFAAWAPRAQPPEWWPNPDA